MADFTSSVKTSLRQRRIIITKRCKDYAWEQKDVRYREMEKRKLTILTNAMEDQRSGMKDKHGL